jgi:hypothetical protein
MKLPEFLRVAYHCQHKRVGFESHRQIAPMMKWAVLLAASILPLAAQWLNYPDAGSPRTKDGKPNLTAPAPRINGRPDLSGVWQAERTPESEFARVLGKDGLKLAIDRNDITKDVINVFWGLKPEEQPLKPEAVAILKERANTFFPSTYCLPAGIPAGIFVFAFKIIQAPHEIVILLEDGDPPRQIHTDERSLPKDPQPSWMGYSVGKWQRDTLIVETIGFNEASWVDLFGHPRSELMRIREHYRRRDFGHMDLEVTLEDPKYYTRPFTLKTELNLIPDSDVLEFVCNENEKDRVHLEKR